MTLTDALSSSAAAAPSLTNSMAGSKTATKGTSGLGANSSVLQKATTRIQAAVDSATTHLSSFGKLKSAVSEVQLASRALNSLTTTASGAGFKLAASSLVSAYNNAIKAARAAALVTGLPAESVGAKRASRELVQAVTADATTLASLKRIGISALPDGTLVLDTQGLDAAQLADPAGAQSTLAKLGGRLDKAATQELASDGEVTGSLSALNRRMTTLTAQQDAMATLADNMATAAQNATGTGFGSYGLAAYLK
jgi:hypothetical protein